MSEDATEFAPTVIATDEDGDYGAFVLPSGNIGCHYAYGADGDWVSCTIQEFDFASTPASDECREAGIPWAAEALHSGNAGHGFRLSKEAQLTW